MNRNSSFAFFIAAAVLPSDCSAQIEVTVYTGVWSKVENRWSGEFFHDAPVEEWNLTRTSVVRRSHAKISAGLAEFDGHVWGNAAAFDWTYTPLLTRGASISTEIQGNFSGSQNWVHTIAIASDPEGINWTSYGVVNESGELTMTAKGEMDNAVAEVKATGSVEFVSSLTSAARLVSDKVDGSAVEAGSGVSFRWPGGLGNPIPGTPGTMGTGIRNDSPAPVRIRTPLADLESYRFTANGEAYLRAAANGNTFSTTATCSINGRVSCSIGLFELVR